MTLFLRTSRLNLEERDHNIEGVALKMVLIVKALLLPIVTKHTVLVVEN